MPTSPRVALNALCVAVCLASATHAAELVAKVEWLDPDRSFGGLSGIDVSADGTRFFAVGDKGIVVEGRFKRDADDLLTEVETVAIHPFTDPKGDVYPSRQTDAEGVDWGGDGKLTVSFEGFHRVEEISSQGARIKRLPRPDFFKQFQNNSSLESVAVDPRGRVYTAPERSGQLDRPFPVYRREGKTWVVAFELPRRDDFLLVGMDYGPDGRLFVLERTLRGLFFATRVRAFTIDPQDRVTEETTVLETASGTHHNLEGISVWRDSAGKLRLTLIADDNFNIFLNTEIVEYMLD